MQVIQSIIGFAVTTFIGSFLILGLMPTELVKWSYDDGLETRTILVIAFCSALYFWETRPGEEFRTRRDFWKIASIVATILISVDLVSARIDYSVEHNALEAVDKVRKKDGEMLEYLEKIEGSLSGIEGSLNK